MTNRADQNWPTSEVIAIQEELTFTSYPEVNTITRDTDSVTAVWFACLNGKFILRIDHDFSESFADVLDSQGRVIGSANRIYADGWAVHTKPYAGYVSDKQVVLVN